MNVQELPQFSPTSILADKELKDVYLIKTKWAYLQTSNNTIKDSFYLDIKIEPHNLAKTVSEIVLINTMIKEFNELIGSIFHSMAPHFKKLNSLSWFREFPQALFFAQSLKGQIIISDIHYVDSSGITMQTSFTSESLVNYQIYVIKKLTSVIEHSSREEEIVLTIVNALNQDFTSLNEKKVLETSLPTKEVPALVNPSLKI